MEYEYQVPVPSVEKSCYCTCIYYTSDVNTPGTGYPQYYIMYNRSLQKASWTRMPLYEYNTTLVSGTEPGRLLLILVLESVAYYLR